jgi:hypothetical protein
LVDDAVRREMPQEEFYYLDDHVLEFSIAFQGYSWLRESLERGDISRIRFAHEIWRMPPEGFYTNFVSELIRLNLGDLAG